MDYLSSPTSQSYGAPVYEDELSNLWRQVSEEYTASHQWSLINPSHGCALLQNVIQKLLIDNVRIYNMMAIYQGGFLAHQFNTLYAIMSPCRPYLFKLATLLEEGSNPPVIHAANGEAQSPMEYLMHSFIDHVQYAAFVVQSEYPQDPVGTDSLGFALLAEMTDVLLPTVDHLSLPLLQLWHGFNNMQNALPAASERMPRTNLNLSHVSFAANRNSSDVRSNIGLHRNVSRKRHSGLRTPFGIIRADVRHKLSRMMERQLSGDTCDDVSFTSPTSPASITNMAISHTHRALHLADQWARAVLGLLTRFDQSPSAHILMAVRFIVKRLLESRYTVVTLSVPNAVQMWRMSAFDAHTSDILLPHLITILRTQKMGDTFKAAVELWFTVIQPWRYAHKPCEYFSATDDNAAEWRNYMSTHLPLYACVFACLLRRLASTPLDNNHALDVLQRVVKVFTGDKTAHFVEVLTELTDEQPEMRTSPLAHSTLRSPSPPMRASRSNIVLTTTSSSSSHFDHHWRPAILHLRHHIDDHCQHLAFRLKRYDFENFSVEDPPLPGLLSRLVAWVQTAAGDPQQDAWKERVRQNDIATHKVLTRASKELTLCFPLSIVEAFGDTLEMLARESENRQDIVD